MFSKGKWCLIIELKHIGNAVDEHREESTGTREVNDIDDTCKLRITRRVVGLGLDSPTVWRTPRNTLL